jgi:hypothetical protein
LFDGEQVQTAAFIGPYLVPDHDTVVAASRNPVSNLTPMTNGSMPNDDGGLLLTADEHRELVEIRPEAAVFCRKFLGSHDSIQGDLRYCLWIDDKNLAAADAIQEIAKRIEHVRKHRMASDRAETNALTAISHAFGERRHQAGRALLIPRHSSESRPYLPSLVVSNDTVIGDSAIAMYEFTMPDLAIYSSRLHLVWIATVCGKIKEDYRYSNSLGWNTFPVPTLTDKNKADLTRCAEDILLAREAHSLHRLAGRMGTAYGRIHRIFDPARLDIEIKDRFGNPVVPREWFLVPMFVIDEVVERIKDGTITSYKYDPRSARLVRYDKT